MFIRRYSRFVENVRKISKFTEEIKKNKIEERCRGHLVFLSRSDLEINTNIDSSMVMTAGHFGLFCLKDVDSLL